MPRGIPWDDLPAGIGERRENPPSSSSSSSALSLSQTPQDINISAGEEITLNVEEEERDYKKDAISVARRVAFGVLCGTMTGASFGAVEILRDAKGMRASKSEAMRKVMRFSGLFGGFFGTYHGIRRVLKMYYPQPAEYNVATAGILSITPLIFLQRGKLRPLIPYSVMLVALDAFNGLND